MPVRPSCSTRSLLAVPRNHWKQPAAGERYRAHLRVVTANSFSLIVGSSGPRNRRSVRAWDQRTLPFSVTSRCNYMPRHRNAACMEVLRCVSSGSLASVVLLGGVSRHHEEGSSPGIADKYSSLQITAAAFLKSSAGSVTGQLPIERLAELYGYSQTPTTGIPVRRAASGRNAQYAEHVAIFTHVDCRALPLQQPAPTIGAIHSSLAWRCDRCASIVLPTHRHPAAPCHQCRRSRGAPSQPLRQSSNLPRTQATFITMLRLAMCGQSNPRAWTTRCAAMRS
ncbi:regulator of sigma E protease [Trypanosoma cruzi]|nr:regulator of sigma E protease [Trypanosoma cruzi]